MKIAQNIHHIGVNDYKIDLFEGQFAVENGMAYNSYIISDEKIAVLDTVDKNFGDDWAKAVEDAFRYGKIILATTTYNAVIFPFMKEFIDHLTERNYQNRTIGMIENGSWAPMAEKTIKTMFEKSKNITFADTTVHIKSALSNNNLNEIKALAKEII